MPHSQRPFLLHAPEVPHLQHGRVRDGVVVVVVVVALFSDVDTNRGAAWCVMISASPAYSVTGSAQSSALM